MNQYIVSVDLGQLSDWTAISIMQEAADKANNPTLQDLMVGAPGMTRAERRYLLRYLERPPMRTPYTEIVERIDRIMHQPTIEANADLVVDATGVGRPIIDMLRERRLSPIAITISGGSTVTRTDDGFTVPKKDLVGSLQSLFGRRKIAIAPGLALAETFITEMERFKIKKTAAGNESYEAWRESDHDDLVLSVAMGAWWVLFSRGQVASYNILDKEEPQYNPLDYLVSGTDT